MDPEKRKKCNENLKPIRSKSEARAKGRKGGKASGESRRTLGSWKSAYKRTLTDEDLDAILNKVRDMAKRGNLNALDRLYRISGEDVEETTYENDQVRDFINAVKSQKKK